MQKISEEALRKLKEEVHPKELYEQQWWECVTHDICPLCGEWLERDVKGWAHCLKCKRIIEGVSD